MWIITDYSKGKMKDNNKYMGDDIVNNLCLDDDKSVNGILLILTN